MAEYIKRKIVADLIIAKARYLSDAREIYKNDEKMLSEIDGYEKALKSVHELILDNDLIEEIQPQTWISVDDRMPEEGESVLICTSTMARSVAARYGKRFFITIVESFSTDEVSHWQPLPEPPKEDDT